MYDVTESASLFRVDTQGIYINKEEIGTDRKMFLKPV